MSCGKFRAVRKAAPGILLLILPFIAPLAAQQSPAPIPLEKEPHHELVFHNKDFLAFRVKMPPGDTLLLHRHANDEAALTISSGATVAIFPGRPELHQKDVPATVRFHRAGVVHQIRNVSDTPYYLHYSISLLHPQKDIRSLCAAADEGGPLNCPPPQTGLPDGIRIEAQYETNQFRASIAHLQPHRSAELGEPDRDEFIVAVEEFVAMSGEKSGASNPAQQVLHPGDFLWIPHGKPSRAIRNDSDHEARFAIFSFVPDALSRFVEAGKSAR